MYTNAIVISHHHYQIRCGRVSFKSASSVLDKAECDVDQAVTDIGSTESFSD